MLSARLATARSNFSARARRTLDRLTVFDLVGIAIAWALIATRLLLSRVGFDEITFTAPAQQITLDAWTDGRMPLWSTTTFGGTPHLGNAFSAGLYPFHWLVAPFPDLLGGDVELMIHMLIFGLGFYCLGRVLAFARPAPLAMAIAAMWSGALLHRSALVAHLPPLAWMPWAAIAIYYIVTSDRPRRLAGVLAVLVWLILTGGHPQSILMVATLMVAWAVGLMFEHRSWQRAGYLVVAALLAVLAAAPMLFAARSTIAAAAASTRDPNALLPPLNVMPLRDLPRFLLGQPTSGISVLRDNERVTYAGAAVVALAIVGAVAAIRARRWSLIALLAVGGFAASLSLGLRSPTMRFARAFIPGFDQPRVSARWNWVFVMTLIVLAGYGIERLRQHRARAEGLAVITAAIGLAFAILLGVEGGGALNMLLWVAIAGLVVLIAFKTARTARLPAAAVLAVLALFELGAPITRLIEWRQPATSSDEFVGPAQLWLAQQPGLTISLTNEGYEPYYIVQSMRPNANTLVGVRSIDGYDGGSAISRRWHAGLMQIIPAVNDLTFRAQLPPVLDEAAMARLGVHYVLWDPIRGNAADALPGWRRQPVDGALEIYENTQWRGDAVVWYQSELVDSPEAAGERLRLDDAELAETAMVEDESAVLPCSVDCTADGFVTTSDYSGHREAEIVAAYPAIVAFHEQFDEGWTVYVDGHEREVIPVDGIWSGVAVEAGIHHIELRYDPAWLWPSNLIMVGGWGAIGAVLLWPLRRLAPQQR